MIIKNYFTHAKIKSFVKVGFFTRNGGVSKKENYSLNCSLNSKDTKVNVNKNIDICLKNLKIKKKIKFISQIHSNKIVKINKKNIGNKYSGDGLITSNKQIALGVLTADCCPIFIFDKNKKYICALHSGWKGALKNIAAKGIEYFVKQKIIKKNIVVLIGPCLSFENFEVSKDFKSKFISKNKKYAIFFKYKNKDKDLFNLRRLINYQFKELGIKNIYNINKDTFSNKKVFFSHRRESQKFRDTGRMLNIIAFND